ncbi:2'-5' RNA ligase family protein [Pontibacter sp. 13R65]|uniref:2'-5' RNA ligase family protein n=1 Tax=Pontibacter sp. 13R65 TaxID=3127458 RepID=UPI00301DD151
MQLAMHYDQLWQSSLQHFRKGEFELDPLIEDKQDNRLGLTLLARIQADVDDRIQALINELQQVEPAQYYYPPSDRHLTLLSIISCYSGFELSQIALEEYLAVVQESLQGISPFSVEIKGITASPSCILLQGFPVGEQLGQLRNQLRQRFKASGLQHSIDKRYAIITAHSTMVRFKAPLQQPQLFLKKLQQYRDYNFGTTTIKEAELVCNDWYQREKHVKLLHTFPLR